MALSVHHFGQMAKPQQPLDGLPWHLVKTFMSHSGWTSVMPWFFRLVRSSWQNRIVKLKVQDCAHKNFQAGVNYIPKVPFTKRQPITESRSWGLHELRRLNWQAAEWISLLSISGSLLSAFRNYGTAFCLLLQQQSVLNSLNSHRWPFLHGNSDWWVCSILSLLPCLNQRQNIISQNQSWNNSNWWS